MADFEQNVHHLSTIRASENNYEIAEQVATDLIMDLTHIYIHLYDNRHCEIVKPFAIHLLKNYQNYLKREYSHEQSARKAMNDENISIGEHLYEIIEKFRRLG
jgi:hypothetical protein